MVEHSASLLSAFNSFTAVHSGLEKTYSIMTTTIIFSLKLGLWAFLGHNNQSCMIDNKPIYMECIIMHHFAQWQYNLTMQFISMLFKVSLAMCS